MTESAWIRGEYRRCKQQGGFTYLGMMLIVLMMGVVLASAAQVWHTSTKRDQELELLFVGNQFRQAIKSYYEHTPPMSRRYPAQLEDLLADPRFISTQRYLRKIYADPITRNTRWGLVRGPSGEIIGIHSLSEKEPIKKSNFDSADRSFENKKKYADWVFMYVPGQSAIPAH